MQNMFQFLYVSILSDNKNMLSRSESVLWLGVMKRYWAMTQQFRRHLLYNKVQIELLGFLFVLAKYNTQHHTYHSNCHFQKQIWVCSFWIVVNFYFFLLKLLPAGYSQWYWSCLDQSNALYSGYIKLIFPHKKGTYLVLTNISILNTCSLLLL